MGIDHVTAAHAELNRYFGDDQARREKCLTLAKHSVWTTNYRMLPPNTALDLAKEVFPSLMSHVEVVHGQPKVGIAASRIPVALLSNHDGDGAAAYFAAVVATKGDYVLNQDNIEGVNEMLHQVEAHFIQALTFTSSQDWASSPERRALKGTILALDPILEMTKDYADSAVLASPIVTRVHNHGDIELFAEMLESPHFSLPNPGSFVLDLGDMWLAAKAGNISLQKKLVGFVEQDMDKFAGPIRTKATLSFWKGVTAHLDALERHGNADDWREIFRQGTEVFNFDALPNGKALLMSRQLFPMLLNMAHLGQRTQAAGVELSIKELRSVLMPIEQSAKLVGRAFSPQMGADYQDMKNALGLLFKDVAPSDLSNRPLPKHLASIMSDVMDSTKWVGKASLRDRGRILSDDLGI